MPKISQRDRRFTEYLEELRGGRDGRAAMAALRRTLGKPPGQVPEIGRYILQWLPSQLSEWQQAEERAYYLVAALFAWHPIAWHRTEKEKGPHKLWGFDARTCESNPERRPPAAFHRNSHLLADRATRTSSARREPAQIAKRSRSTGLSSSPISATGGTRIAACKASGHALSGGRARRNRRQAKNWIPQVRLRKNCEGGS